MNKEFRERSFPSGLENCVLAIDVGTSALKAAVIRADGEVLDFCREEFAPIKIPCGQKFSQKWIFAFGEACKKIKGAISAARAICFSGNGPTLVFDDGTTLLWNEPIGKNAELEDDALCSSDIFCEAKKSIFIPRILAVKNIFPAQWNESEKIFSCPEFLINEICGAQITILPEARFKGAYWTDEILDALKIPRGKLCDFFSNAKIAGRVTDKAAEKFGLPRGIPVVGAGPDFVAALIGTATTKPGALCDRAGSSEGLNLCTPFPIVADEIRTLPSPVAPFWNASFLIEDPGNTNFEKTKNFAEGVRALRRCAEKHGVFFDDTIAITGGQSRDENLIQEKADAAEMKIALGQIPDAELLGDAAIAFAALGEFDSLQNASATICKRQKIFYPKNSKGEK